MPLINVIRGQELPDSMFNVRTPILRIPLWMAVCWWLIRGVARVVVVYVRFWYATVPATVLWVLYLRYGWAGPLVLVGGLAGAAGGRLLVHRASFLRFGVYPALGRWRRMGYRRRWYPAMATARLAVTFDRHTVLPVLRKARSTPGRDVVTVRMVTGQIPDDFAAVALRLTHTFGALSCRVTAGKSPDLVVLTLRRRDALGRLVGPLAVPVVPDFTALPAGLTEDGEVRSRTRARTCSRSGTYSPPASRCACLNRRRWTWCLATACVIGARCATGSRWRPRVWAT